MAAAVVAVVAEDMAAEVAADKVNQMEKNLVNEILRLRWVALATYSAPPQCDPIVLCNCCTALFVL